MRYLVPVLALLCAACGSDADVRGTLLDEGAAAEVRAVWLVGREGRAELQDGEFELRGIPAGSMDLRLAGERGEIGRLWIQEVPRRAEVRLEQIWVNPASGMAFPSRVELRGARTITINGIRMAPPERPGRRLRAEATVLALSDAVYALLARPHDDRLPDLRIVLTQGTEFLTPDGDPVPLASVTVGDSIRVEGTTEQGYLIATRIVLPRYSAVRPDDGES